MVHLREGEGKLERERKGGGGESARRDNKNSGMVLESNNPRRTTLNCSAEQKLIRQFLTSTSLYQPSCVTAFSCFLSLSLIIQWKNVTRRRLFFTIMIMAK